MNFNDLPCNIKRMIFDINRRDAHLNQIRNYRPKYWPYCIHNRKCYESMIDHDADRVKVSYIERFNKLRASGYVYNDKFIWMDRDSGPHSQNILGKIPLKDLEYNVTSKQVSRIFIRQDYDSDTDTDDDY
eukprot:SAG11_NODE_167_length_13647_cov_7.705049_10_plen_130_part_00